MRSYPILSYPIRALSVIRGQYPSSEFDPLALILGGMQCAGIDFSATPEILTTDYVDDTDDVNSG